MRGDGQLQAPPRGVTLNHLPVDLRSPQDLAPLDKLSLAPGCPGVFGPVPQPVSMDDCQMTADGLAVNWLAGKLCVARHCPAMADALPKRAMLVVNAASRNGEAVFEEAREKLIAAGLELIDAHVVHDPKVMEPVVKAAVSRAPMVIVGGGDGTLSAVVDHFVGKDTVFAVLPVGTANSFARSLGLPLDIDGAIDVIAYGRRKQIDLGMINGDYFANVAAIGMSPLIADTVPAGLKRYLGIFGYIIWALRVAFKFRPFRLRITLEDGTIERVWATEARIANGSHQGGFLLVEEARLDSGEMIIQAVTGKSVFGLAWSWFATLFRLRRRAQTVTEWRGRHMMLDSKPHQKISIDGEISAKTPASVECARGAIEVAAPR
jgi:YegS/Rv2252/BmrU family lipid kinase